MINLSNKFNLILFLVLFFKDNFSINDYEIKIFNPGGQECIEDKNRKLYPIWRFDSNTGKKEIENFLDKFSYNKRTDNEKEIIKNLFYNNVLDEKNFLDKKNDLIFGKNIDYGKNALFYFLKNFNDINYNIGHNIIVIEDIDNNFKIKYIGGLISFKKKDQLPYIFLEKIIKNKDIFEIEYLSIKKKDKLPYNLEKIIKNKDIFEIDSLSICSKLQKNGLGSQLLKKLDFSDSIFYLCSDYEAYDFYKKNGFKQIIDKYSNCFYRINESNYLINIYGIPYNLIKKIQRKVRVL